MTEYECFLLDVCIRAYAYKASCDRNRHCVKTVAMVAFGRVLFFHIPDMISKKKLSCLLSRNIAQFCGRLVKKGLNHD